MSLQPRTLSNGFVHLCADRRQGSNQPRSYPVSNLESLKAQGISPRVKVPDEQCLGHLPTPELCLHWSQWLLQPGHSQALLSKDGLWYSRGFDFVLLWTWAVHIYDQSLPIESWPEGMDRTTSRATLSSAQGERSSVFPQSKNHGFRSALKQEKRRLCFVFTLACSWNRSRANFIFIAASDNIENFLRSHLMCPNDRCPVNNLAKWCLGTSPCSSSLWLIVLDLLLTRLLTASLTLLTGEKTKHKRAFQPLHLPFLS